MTAVAAAARIHDSYRSLRERGHFRALVAPLGIPLTVLLELAFIDGVTVHSIFRLMVAALALAALLTIGLGLVLRDPDRGAIGALLLMALGPFHGNPLGIMALAGIAFLAVVWDRLPSRRYEWRQVTGAVNKFAAVLLVVVVAGGVADGSLARMVQSVPQGGGLPAADSSPLVDPASPDIYVLLLDGYARSDTLSGSCGYDNRPFTDALRQRGFSVAANSHSNYPVTAQTFASTLNMAYLDAIPALANVHGGDPAFDGSYRQAINDNRVFTLLRAHDYQIVTTGSGWEQLAIRESDVYLDGGELNTFEWSVLHEMGYAGLIQAIAPSLAGDQARSRIQTTFAEVEETARTPTPKPRLVFAHVLAPHPPLVFGPNGEPLSQDLDQMFKFGWTSSANDAQAIAGYVGQLRYANSQVLLTIDEILAAARRPTVVIVMSDHGSRLFTPAGSNLMTPEADRNFFAALTPGHENLFGDSPTPVNLFRVLANAYLGQSMPPLDNKSYVSRWGEPTELIPLTPDQL